MPPRKAPWKGSGLQLRGEAAPGMAQTSDAADPAFRRPGATGAPVSAPIVLGARDLPAYCPNPKMPLWSWHPRVFLDVVNEGETMCPYCGTRYRLAPWVRDPDADASGLHQHHREPRLEPEHDPEAGLRADHPAGANLEADARGNTTLELITRWLRRLS